MSFQTGLGIKPLSYYIFLKEPVILLFEVIINNFLSHENGFQRTVQHVANSASQENSLHNQSRGVQSEQSMKIDSIL